MMGHRCYHDVVLQADMSMKEEERLRTYFKNLGLSDGNEDDDDGVDADDNAQDCHHDQRRLRRIALTAIWNAF